MSGYATDLNLAVKLLSRNPRGVLAEGDATAMSLLTTSRAWKPLPPGNVRLNGLDYEHWPATTAGDVTLSWAHRNRTLQGTGLPLVAQDASSAATKEGSYMVEVLIAGVVKRTWSGLTGTSQVYTLAQRTADDADLGKAVQFRITPVNGALQGTVRTTPGFVMGS